MNIACFIIIMGYLLYPFCGSVHVARTMFTQVVVVSDHLHPTRDLAFSNAEQESGHFHPTKITSALKDNFVDGHVHQTGTEI